MHADAQAHRGESADALLERTTMIEDDAGDEVVELRHQLDRSLGPQRFAQPRESPDVGEEDRHSFTIKSLGPAGVLVRA
jgi:hypothetical protein